MRRHPVEDHADPLLVQMIDQEHQVLGRSKARRGGEIPRGLIAPGTVERVFRNRHQFDMRESEVVEVIGQQRRHLSIAQKRAIAPAPGSQMRLVDGHGCVEAIARAPPRHPINVAPAVIQIPCAGCSGRRQFAEKTDRICLVHSRAVAPDDAIFVGLAMADRPDTAFPDARTICAGRQRICIGTPAVPIPHDGHARRIGRPHGEMGALRRGKMAAEPPVGISQRPFAEEIDVLLTGHGGDRRQQGMSRPGALNRRRMVFVASRILGMPRRRACLPPASSPVGIGWRCRAR